MNEPEFNRQLKRISKDLELLWEPVTRRWGVYQIRSTKILTAPGSVRPWLLFDIVNEDRTFRLPDQRDLRRAARAVYAGHNLWDKGGDWYEDKLEENEQAARDKRTERTNDTIKQAAKDLAYHVNRVKTRGRGRNDVGTAGIA